VPNLSLWLLMAASSIRVTGADACPSPDAVQRKVAALVGGATGWSATLRNTPGGLQIVLAEADGAVVSRRVIPRLASNTHRSCEDLAEIVALVLASWLSNLSSQAVSAEPLPSLSIPSPLPSSAERSWSWEVGLGATGSVTGGGLAPGGLLQLEAGPARARWALRILAAYDGPRQTPEGPGAVSWQRFQGGLGASYELLRGSFSLEVGGDVVLSDIALRGLGFPTDSSSTSLEAGAELGVRLALLREHWHPWIGIWATLWTRQEVPSVQGLALQSALPPVEGFVGLGLSWRSVERF